MGGPFATGRPVVQAPAAAADWWTTSDVGQFVKTGFEALGSSMFGSIASGGAGWILSQFLEGIGLEKVNDFLFPLQHMSEQLDAISKQLTVVQTLVEENIQTTAQSRHSELAANAAPTVGEIKSLMWRVQHPANSSPTDPTLNATGASLAADIKPQLITNGDAAVRLHSLLTPPALGPYGIIQAASAYLGSRTPFFTPESSAVVQAIFDYYQLAQLQLGILLTNY